jgi:hypothetical protein
MPEIVLFGTGVLLGVPFNLMGNLLAGEILLAIFAVAGVLMNFNNPGFLDRKLIVFTALFALSLLVYVATDFALQTELHNAARGWARFVFLIVDFVGFYVIARKSRKSLFPIFIGYMLAQTVIWLRPQADIHWYVTAWKHHLCLPVLVGSLCLVKKPLSSIAILMTAGIVSFQIDTRAFGTICFITAALLIARLALVKRIERLMPVVLTVSLIVCALGVNTFLDRTNDRFGKRQLGSNELRYAAFLTAWQSIAINPWMGIGSWKTDFEAANRHRANLIEAGGKHDTETYDQSGHSQILQTWLEGGPLAALAFFYLLWRMLRALQWTLSRPVDRFLAFAIFILLNGIWSCLFSPFLGADVRVNTAIAIYVCISLARERTNLMRASA